MDFAFLYIKFNNGIDTESSYPYEARNGSCRFDPKNVGATDTVSTFERVYEKMFLLFMIGFCTN